MGIFSRPAKFALIVVSGASLSVLASPQALATGPECRGVAAGVVAGMRASGEVNTQEASEIAILAARRACTAAREELGAPTSTTSNEATESPGEDGKKFTMWDLLSSDQESKPGSKRLKRLRQQ